MRTLLRLRKLWRNLFDRQRVERELDEEIRSYRDMLADENAGSGMNPPDARRMAAIEIGGIEQSRNSFGRFDGIFNRYPFT